MEDPAIRDPDVGAMELTPQDSFSTNHSVGLPILHWFVSARTSVQGCPGLSGSTSVCWWIFFSNSGCRNQNQPSSDLGYSMFFWKNLPINQWIVRHLREMRMWIRSDQIRILPFVTVWPTSKSHVHIRLWNGDDILFSYHLTSYESYDIYNILLYLSIWIHVFSCRAVILAPFPVNFNVQND